MENTNLKCVMVIDEELPVGIIANTAAVMGVTIGKYFPQTVGETVTDQTGHEHLGVIEFPIPVLKGQKEQIKELRTALYAANDDDLKVVDFSDIAQSCKNYQEYIKKMADIGEDKLNYFGITICGDKRKINKLTGNIGLLR